MADRCAVMAGPVRAQGPGGRARWDWRIERTVAGRTEGISVGNRAAAVRTLRDQLSEALTKGYVVDARFVEQTGYGEEATYHPDGRRTNARTIEPADGLIGPRCFQLPFTASEKKARTQALRQGAGKLKAEPKKPKSKKPRAAKPSKPPKKPKSAKPPKSMPALVKSYLHALENPESGGNVAAARWIGTHKPLEFGRVVRWINQHGSVDQKRETENARKLAAKYKAEIDIGSRPRTAKTRPTSKPSGSKPTSKPKTPKPISRQGSGKPTSGKPASPRPVSKPPSGKPTSGKPRSGPHLPVAEPEFVPDPGQTFMPERPRTPRPITPQLPPAPADPALALVRAWMDAQKAALGGG